MIELPGIPPRVEARIVGVLYLLNILLGITAIWLSTRHMQARSDQLNFVAAIVYTVVTVLLWHLFLPTGKWISAVAATFSLLGCWVPPSVYSSAHINNLASFGAYCVLIALLVLRSRFFPSGLAVAMGCSGFCWLTTLWHPLYHALSPYVMIAGALGETIFMGYLVIKGLDELRWRDQARLSAVNAL